MRMSFILPPPFFFTHGRANLQQNSIIVHYSIPLTYFQCIKLCIMTQIYINVALQCIFELQIETLEVFLHCKAKLLIALQKFVFLMFGLIECFTLGCTFCYEIIMLIAQHV